jgi:hypothetical protein
MNRSRDSHALQGGVLSISDAATTGRWPFGDLLLYPTDKEAP